MSCLIEAVFGSPFITLRVLQTLIIASAPSTLMGLATGEQCRLTPPIGEGDSQMTPEQGPLNAQSF